MFFPYCIYKVTLPALRVFYIFNKALLDAALGCEDKMVNGIPAVPALVGLSSVGRLERGPRKMGTKTKLRQLSPWSCV